MGERNAVDLPLIILETFMAEIAFRTDHMDLMGQIDGAFGVTLDARGFGPLMAGEAAIHARPIRFGGHLIVHDIVMTKGTLSACLLDMKFMGDVDFHHVIFEGLNILLWHIRMAAHAVGVRSFRFCLVIAGDPFGMASMALGAVDLRVNQRFL